MNRKTSYPVPVRRRATAQAITIAATRKTPSVAWTTFTVATLAGAAALAVLLLSGCNSGEKTFAKINGQIVTEQEYLHQLERQTVSVAGGQPTNAERVVLDQIISNRVILAEASKAGVMPGNETVDKMYNVQKNLFMAQFPGKSYEDAQKEQGTTIDEIKSDLKVQLAETALYGKLLKLDESEVRTTYDKYRTAFGLPPRVQLRLAVAAEKTPEFTKIAEALGSGKSFDAVAKEMNPLPMRGNGGLLPQAVAINTLAPAMQAKVTQTPEGKFFGPIDFQQKGVKAWIKIEKRLPEYMIPYEDAAPLVRRQLVQLKLQDPKNQSIKNDILQKKMAAKFESEDKGYETVWNGVKDAASKAGIGQSTGLPAAGAAAGAPAAGTMAAPAAP